VDECSRPPQKHKLQFDVWGGNLREPGLAQTDRPTAMVKGHFVYVGQPDGEAGRGDFALGAAHGEGMSRNPYNAEIAMEHLGKLDLFLAIPLVGIWYVYTSYWLAKLARKAGLPRWYEKLAYVPVVSQYVAWVIAADESTVATDDLSIFTAEQAAAAEARRDEAAAAEEANAAEGDGHRRRRHASAPTINGVPVSLLFVLHQVMNVMRLTHGYAVLISIVLWGRIAQRRGKPLVLGMLMPLMFHLPVATLAQDSWELRRAGMHGGGAGLRGGMGDPYGAPRGIGFYYDAQQWQQERELAMLEAVLLQRAREEQVEAEVEEQAVAVDKAL